MAGKLMDFAFGGTSREWCLCHYQKFDMNCMHVDILMKILSWDLGLAHCGGGAGPAINIQTISEWSRRHQFVQSRQMIVNLIRARSEYGRFDRCPEKEPNQPLLFFILLFLFLFFFNFLQGAPTARDFLQDLKRQQLILFIQHIQTHPNTRGKYIKQ